MSSNETKLKITHLNKLYKTEAKMLKQACRHLGDLLDALLEAQNDRTKGHNNWEQIIAKEFSKSEEFLDNIGW
jgi:hypothetical protein